MSHPLDLLFATRLRLRVLAMLTSMVMGLALLGGCKLVFEPPADAVDRFFNAAVERDFREIKDMISKSADPAALESQMREVAGAFNNLHYKGMTDYWRVASTQDDEPNDLTYATVIVQVPYPTRDTSRRASRPRPPQDVELVFAMRRENLSWYVLNIDGMDTLLRKIHALTP